MSLASRLLAQQKSLQIFFADKRQERKNAAEKTFLFANSNFFWFGLCDVNLYFFLLCLLKCSKYLQYRRRRINKIQVAPTFFHYRFYEMMELIGLQELQSNVLTLKLSIYLSIYPSIYLSIYLSIYIYIFCLVFVKEFVYLKIYLCVFLFAFYAFM